MSFWAALGQGLLNVGTGFLNQAFTWNKEDSVRQQMWDRDDSAIQRRVEDLKAAGLSPTLAAGSAAGNTATSITPSNIQSPDIINSVAQIQGIKNAKEENANLRTARLQMYSQTEKNYADMMKSRAESNYFNAMANKAMIDGDWASILGAAQLSEMNERTKGYQYSAMKNYVDSVLSGQKALREGLESDLILSTGMNSGNSSLIGTLSKWFARGLFSTAELFGNRDSYRYKISDKLNSFKYD